MLSGRCCARLSAAGMRDYSRVIREGQPHRAVLGDTIAWKAAGPRRPAYRVGRTRRGIRNSVARSQSDVPCTTVVRHTEEPLSGARQTAVRADIAWPEQALHSTIGRGAAPELGVVVVAWGGSRGSPVVTSELSRRT
eukprot:scaffold28224_cov58-Phaeocystis_antarctica.AAC.2